MELLAQFLVDDTDADAMRAAQRLIAHFGTFAATLDYISRGYDLPDGFSDATRTRLTELTATLTALLEKPSMPLRGFDSVDAVVAYLKPGMSTLPVENFRVIFLDGANCLIADQTMWVGTVDRVQVHVREVVRQALALDAVSLIVAHNHVSTAPTPSQQDLALTARLINACRVVDLRVNDHVIVSRSGCFSMRAGGVLDDLERTQQLKEAA